MQKSRILVLANDTNVGKTWLCCELLERARKENFLLFPYKPIATGDKTDAARLAASSGFACELDLISPVFFSAPMAPYAASLLENKPLNWLKIETHLDEIEKNCQAVLIESAGGLLTPCDRDTDMLDLAIRWNALSLMVAPNKLGSLTQCRCALEVMLQRKVAPLAVVLNSLPQTLDDISHHQNETLILTRSMNIQILTNYYPNIPFFDTTSSSLDKLWGHIKVYLT